jgi:hypothetical protein
MLPTVRPQLATAAAGNKGARFTTSDLFGLLPWFLIRKIIKGGIIMYKRSGLRALAATLLPCALAVVGLGFSQGMATAAPGSVIFSDAPGTSAPPPTLGSYQMTPFPADTQAVGATVSSVVGPTGNLGFSAGLRHCLTPNPDGCWQTWSNGYSGDVYASSSQSLTMTLPSSTKAFYFYAEPEQFMTFSITATSDDGTTSGAVPVGGQGGAEYFGFYATGSATISTITVTGADPDGFAVGEFGVSDGTFHYTVNAEAWIPFKSVVDPLFAIPLPYLTTADPVDESLDPNCYTPPGLKKLSTFVSSTYGGDGHAAFGTGTYRLRTEVSFVFDPATGKITNFTQDTVPAFGASHRTKVYTSNGTVLATCTQAADTTNTQVANLTSDTSFSLGYSGKNPLSRPAGLTPPAHALITGTVTPDGTLTLSYTSTEFPSQGIQVSVNGSPVNTDTENDVSCIGASGVLGFAGAARIAYGINATKSGSVTIHPTGHSTESTPSPLC